MRHSSEESISQLSSTQAKEQDVQQFWYDGIISTVNSSEARTQIFYFPLEEELTIEEMPSAFRAFESRTKSGMADKCKKFSNQPPSYNSPQGFLICLRKMMAGISEAFRNRSENDRWIQLPIRSKYVYNATLYQLRMDKIKVHDIFGLSLPVNKETDGSMGNRFRNVAEAKFKICDKEGKERHSFVCWFPMEGRLEGIPIQIQDNPRWWLQVRLQLISMEESDISLPWKDQIPQ
jgi:hypothetical protein